MENNKRLRLFSRMYFIQWLFLTALFSLVTMNGYAQGKAVTGKIIDSTGEPVIGASVLVKGTSNGVISMRPYRLHNKYLFGKRLG